MINNVKYNFTMGVATSFATHLQGSLDTGNWCTGGTYQTGKEELTYQTTTAVYEVTVLNQWARANEVSGMLTMSLGIMVPLPDKSAQVHGRNLRLGLLPGVMP